MNHKLNYLDITIHRTPTNIKKTVYRKPTFTDTIIPLNSNHPAHHKYAAIRFLFNRLNSYNLDQDEYKQELNIIHNILYNSNYPIKACKPSTNTHTPTDPPPTTKKKWATFTYIGKETTYITNLFKKTDLKIAFRTTNTIDKLLTHKHTQPDKFSGSGVYKLTCPDCHRACIGQTGRRFTTRFKEHEAAFRHNPNASSFAKHLTENNHSFGPMPNIMQPLQLHKKGPHLNTLEKFHIYTEFRANNHLNDEHFITTNAIFDTLCQVKTT
jgi:hypothetical protein